MSLLLKALVVQQQVRRPMVVVVAVFDIMMKSLVAGWIGQEVRSYRDLL